MFVTYSYNVYRNIFASYAYVIYVYAYYTFMSCRLQKINIYMYIHIYIYVSYACIYATICVSDAYFINVYTCIRNICVHILYIHIIPTPLKIYSYMYIHIYICILCILQKCVHILYIHVITYTFTHSRVGGVTRRHMVTLTPKNTCIHVYI